MTAYDEVAEVYDSSRGGERRGHDYAGKLDRHLFGGSHPVLEIGIGTGVVGLGLSRLGRAVIGIDMSPAMLARAQARLGTNLVLGDARRLPFSDASIEHAVSVWVVHAVEPPEALFAEGARVLRPGGRYLVCPTNRIRADDPIAPILEPMLDEASRIHPTWQRNPVNAADIVAWGSEAGFAGRIKTFDGDPWKTTAEDEALSITRRVWPALRGLDDDAYRRITQPALEALQSLPGGPITRRAAIDVAVLTLGRAGRRSKVGIPTSSRSLHTTALDQRTAPRSRIQWPGAGRSIHETAI